MMLVTSDLFNQVGGAKGIIESFINDKWFWCMKGLTKKGVSV
jgi:hypothetical protein